jgi:amino acid adenylation domain-containing protein
MTQSVTLLHDYLAHSARRLAEKVALVCGSRHLTYGVLDRDADRLAAVLAQRGLQRGDRVVIFAANSVETVIAFWAVLKANAVASIVNPLSKPGKLVYCLNDLAASMIIAEGSLANVFARAAAEAPHLRAVVVFGDIDERLAHGLPGFTRFGDALAAGAEVSKPARRCIDLDLASIIYTSGSTGDPKGVMLTHRNMVAAATSIAAYLGNVESDVFLCALPLAFDYGLYQMIMSIAAGARLVLEPSFALVPQVAARMSRERVTALPLLPTHCALLAEMKSLAALDLRSVRYVTVSGAAFTAQHLRFLRHAFPEARIFSMFGLTECKRCAYLPPEDLERKPTSVGIAIPNTELWLVDEDGREVGPHEIGQLVIRGATVMQGYWNDPGLSAQRLKPGPLPGERVLYTGDLCRRDDEGYLYFVARMDDIIKSRGEKVAPRAIEAILSEMPEVKEAAVIGVPDLTQGQAIKAFVVLHDDASLSAAEIKARCRGTLEPSHVPKHVQFLSALPRGATGKIDKTALS